MLRTRLAVPRTRFSTRRSAPLGPSARLRRLLRCAALLVIAALAGACQADFEVDIEVEEDGSGIVRTELVLDSEASAALLDLGADSTGLPLRDLAESGWTIGPLVEDASGQTRITAEKAFGNPNQFAEVMTDLVGEDGVAQDFVLVREQSFGRVDYTVTGVLDPQGGLESFSDPELEAALGNSLESIVTGTPYNASPEDISVTVTVELPGEFRTEAVSGAVEATELGQQGTWRVNLAQDPPPVEVAIRTTRRSISAQVLRGVAVVAGVLAALIAFAQLLRIAGSRRRRRPTAPKARPADARGRPSEPEQEPSEPEPEKDLAILDDAGPQYKVVALDGMGVLYKEGDDVNTLLIPFARSRGATASDEDIALKVRLLSLGRLSSSEFWPTIGVEGDPNELDSAYLASHQLMPGVVRYLRSLRDAGVRVACITNDAAAWAMKLRAGHSLEGLIDPWVVSGSVGVRKPDAPLFEVLRRVTGEAPASILVVDDDLDSLDAARDLGFATAWFTGTGERSDARGHDLLRNFDMAGPEEEAPPVEAPPIGSP